MNLVERLNIGVCGLCNGPVYRERYQMECAFRGEIDIYKICCDGCRANPPQQRFPFVTNPAPNTDYQEKADTHDRR